MFRRIFTAEERAAIKRYLAKDGEKEQRIRNIVYESKKHLPTIRQDLALLEKLLAAYQRHQQTGYSCNMLDVLTGDTSSFASLP